ncbi:MAG: hypothetical protein QXT86_13190 [Archaeoglobaceae archaeon]
MIYVSGMDRSILELVGVFLERKGYSFEMVPMESLIEKCQKNKPKIVFLELDNEGGVEYVNGLRSSVRGVNIILAVSSLWCERTGIRKNRENSIDILTKPFSLQNLVEIIDSRLKENGGEA